MTESFRGDKLKRRLSLSLKKKKKVEVKAGPSASTITSFFSSQPPPQLACPLCGLRVPRLRVNEHIDRECQNFERGDSPPGSPHVSQVPPRSRESPGPDQKVETKRSPYFKTSTSEQNPLETNQSVVRTVELGRLSSKLSRNYHNTPERRPTEDKEALGSSQKENVLIQRLDDEEDVEVLTSSVDAPSCPGTGHNASKSHLSTSSRLTKRKKGDGALAFQKKSKCEEKSVEPASSSRSTETTDVDQGGTEGSSSCGPHVTSEETCQQNMAGVSGDSETQSSNPSSLPYYLRNFCAVLHAVLENEDDRALFSQEDMTAVHTFEHLSGAFMHQLIKRFEEKVTKINESFGVFFLISCSRGSEAVCEALSEETEMAPGS